jgi:ribosomal protein L40E
MINLPNLVQKKPITDKCCENSPQWKGDDASYSAIHNWVIVHYGKAVKCRKCGRTDLSVEWANLPHTYKRDIRDWVPLCASCHRRRDYGNICKSGHKFTPTNTYVTPKGFRQCRKCQVERVARFKGL